MTRWTPLSIYLTALCYTTGIVIMAGTFAVQAWSEWPTIRGTGTPMPTPHESSPTHGAVKPAPRSFHAHSSAVTSVGAIPGTHNPVFFALDGGWDRRSSVHGVRRVPARGVVLEVFTETGRGPSLQSVVHAAAGLCGVDQPLAWSLALRESSGRHWDASGAVLRSSSGAVGILQIKPSTARDVASDLDVMQPWGNALAALCHFRRLLDKARGDRHLALRWYHRGEYAKGPAPKASHDYATDIIEGSN